VSAQVGVPLALSGVAEMLPPAGDSVTDPVTIRSTLDRRIHDRLMWASVIIAAGRPPGML
jgi:hypothetical protein